MSRPMTSESARTAARDAVGLISKHVSLNDGDRIIMTMVVTGALLSFAANEAAAGVAKNIPDPIPPRQWPHEGHSGWNLNAAEFVAKIVSCPMMWLRLHRAKYIELRIDTRDGGFNLYDRDRNWLNPDDVIKAIDETVACYGPEIASAPYRSRHSPPASTEPATDTSGGAGPDDGGRR